MRILILPLVAGLLGGCASSNDVAMIQAHYDARRNHDTQQTKQVRHKARYIKDMFDYQCPENAQGSELCGYAKAMSNMMGADKIAGIRQESFGEEKPITSLDVQETGIKKLAAGIPMIPLTVGVYKQAGNDQASAEIHADNGSTVSYTLDEDHATALGENSTATNTPSGDSTEIEAEESESKEGEESEETQEETE